MQGNSINQTSDDGKIRIAADQTAVGDSVQADEGSPALELSPGELKKTLGMIFSGQDERSRFLTGAEYALLRYELRVEEQDHKATQEDKERVLREITARRTSWNSGDCSIENLPREATIFCHAVIGGSNPGAHQLTPADFDLFLESALLRSLLVLDSEEPGATKLIVSEKGKLLFDKFVTQFDDSDPVGMLNRRDPYNDLGRLCDRAYSDIEKLIDRQAAANEVIQRFYGESAAVDSALAIDLSRQKRFSLPGALQALSLIPNLEYHVGKVIPALMTMIATPSGQFGGDKSGESALLSFRNDSINLIGRIVSLLPEQTEKFRVLHDLVSLCENFDEKLPVRKIVELLSDPAHNASCLALFGKIVDLPDQKIGAAQTCDEIRVLCLDQLEPYLSEDVPQRQRKVAREIFSNSAQGGVRPAVFVKAVHALAEQGEVGVIKPVCRILSDPTARSRFKNHLHSLAADVIRLSVPSLFGVENKLRPEHRVELKACANSLQGVSELHSLYRFAIGLKELRISI